ncbi:hypothetical protein LEN26_020416 [Aphanomyces euteiches]|nr:hypothetical protein LEN26_020416 [Aphanomyces euteiches]KAH9127076.1 hypothetical protein AeMF1_002561 [Aphanomyces euteiches]KAH9189106.1 hypothetical protein AeNC1_008914 [Aphanomyces euteiches]
MVLWIAFVLAAWSSVATTSSPIHLDIVNGTVIDQASIPAYIATVRGEELQTTECTGILIASRYVLTTAVCTKMNPSWVTINSKFRLGGDGEHIPILTTVVHPKFLRVALTHDIAVLLLARPSVNTPATLTFDIYEPGTKVVMRGFGRLDFNADFADTLREAKGTIAEKSVCNQADRLDRLFQDDMICVMGLTTCTLDIGGPLTIVNKEGQEAVVALQSWDSYLCKGPFGGFTRLSASQDFIKPFLQGDDVCKRPVERPSLH